MLAVDEITGRPAVIGTSNLSGAESASGRDPVAARPGRHQHTPPSRRATQPWSIETWSEVAHVTAAEDRRELRQRFSSSRTLEERVSVEVDDVVIVLVESETEVVLFVLGDVFVVLGHFEVFGLQR